MNGHELAIIIPAYKPTFLKRTLESFCLQTNNNFTVYIGNDGSPFDLDSIIDEYSGKLNIIYKKFESNLGAKDLVAHWERCLNLINDEKWLWLFSDDDIMPPNCVDLFYKEIENSSDYDLFHFNVQVINDNDTLIEEFNAFPKNLSVNDFFRLKSKGFIKSYLVEYVFKREAFEKCGGFQKFDLAWYTDDATWIKIGRKKGIRTIEGEKIQWRRSSENISPNITLPIIRRKLNCCIEFFNWLSEYNYENKLGIQKKYINDGFRFMFRAPSQYVSLMEIRQLIERRKATKFDIYYSFLYFVLFRTYVGLRKFIQSK